MALSTDEHAAMCDTLQLVTDRATERADHWISILSKHIDSSADEFSADDRKAWAGDLSKLGSLVETIRTLSVEERSIEKRLEVVETVDRELEVLGTSIEARMGSDTSV